MTEEKMIKRIKKRKEDALEFFIENYAGLMKSVIKKTLWQYPDDWEGVLNEAVFAVWENMTSYQPEKSSFKNWCASIARYRSIDFLRREKREQASASSSIIELASVRTPLQAPDSEKPEVEAILKRLSPEDEAIFREIFIEEKSYESCAAARGVSTASLYNRVSRGRKKLKKEMRGEGGNEIRKSL